MMNVPMSFTCRFVLPKGGVILDNALYKKYKNMISKAAWAATKVCTESFDELMSRGNLLFCEAYKSWDKTKGAFSTHLTWKLLTLKQTASEMYAPKTCSEERTFWHSLEAGTVGKEGDEISCDPYNACTEYSEKISQTEESAEWADRIGDFRSYLDAMDEDSRMLCEDILDGKFDEEKYLKGLGRKGYINHMTCIPATRYYTKRYVKFGWNLERVKAALENLRQMVRLWQADKLPCKLTKSVAESVGDLF